MLRPSLRFLVNAAKHLGTHLRLPLRRPPRQRVKTPTVLQMEAVECGAASLAIVLAYHGRIVPLEELRTACGVSRDGTKASNLLKAAHAYGLGGKGFRKEPADLPALPLPLIVFWNFNHFLVVEGFARDRVYLNDPASGPRQVSAQEFDEGFTGVALAFQPGPDFRQGGERRGLIAALRPRLAGSATALAYVVLVTLALVILGLVVPTFTRVFVDNYLVRRLDGWVPPLLLAMALAAAVRAALTWLQQSYLLRLETKLAVSTSSRFLWHVLRLPIEFFTQRYGGEVVSRVRLNDSVAQLLTRDLTTAAIGVIMIVFYAVLMFQYDRVLTLLGIGIALLNLLALRHVSRRRIDGNRQLLQESGKLLGAALGGLQMIETIKATGSEDDFFTRWSGHFAKVANAKQELDLWTHFLAVVPALLSTLATVAILAVGTLRVMDGYLTIGMLVAFQVLMASFLSPVNSFVNLGAGLQEADGDLVRMTWL